MACTKNKYWNWKSGSLNIDTSTGVDFIRNYFDCGIYYFDGEFNVVKFPKGMNLFHGSFILADNVVEFPLGIKFYEKYKYFDNNPNNKKFTENILSIAATSDENIETILTDYPSVFPITAGWYGDPKVAKGYAGRKCDNKCIFSFKLKKDIVMIMIDDDYNIAKILNSSIYPDNMKNNLKNMFTIYNQLPYELITDNPFKRIKYLSKNRISDRNWDLPFAEDICKFIISKNGYSGYCATKQYSTYHQPNFHLEFIFCNALKYMSRDLENVMDWQYNKNMKNIINNPNNIISQMSLYETTNVDFHSGNLLEHSIWSLLFMEFYLNKNIYTMNWINNIDKKVISFTAFIHDIGKMNVNNSNIKVNNKRKKFIYFNVPDHPKIGGEYILEGKKMPIFDFELNQIGYLDINNLFYEYGIPIEYKYLIATLIDLHWYYGKDVVGNYNNSNKTENEIIDILNKYNNKCFSIFQTYFPDNFKTKENYISMIKALILLSIIDVEATQPYGINRIERGNIKELNKESIYYPNITNLPKKYRGGNMFTASNMYSVGIMLGEKLIEFINNKM